MSDNHDDIMLALGEIKGQIVGIKETQTLHGQELRATRNDINALQIKAATSGATYGTVAGIGVSLIIASIKELFSNGGGNGPLA